MLELLLRRMSDPSQLVELMAQPSSSPRSPGGLPARAGPGINPFVITSDQMPANSDRTNRSTNDTAADGVGGVVDALQGAPETLANTADARAGANATHFARPGKVVDPVSPALSPMELQSLLLNVATAEGIAKITAMARRAASGVNSEGGGVGFEGIGGDGGLSGGVGEAAVEMLGRLTNQLLSRSELRIFPASLHLNRAIMFVSVIFRGCNLLPLI